MAIVDPFEILSQYSTQVHQVARKLPRNVLNAFWSGVAVQVMGHSYLTPLSGIVEIVSAPRLTRVPLAQPWLVGVMNLRGRLLSVTDVEHWLTGQPAQTPSPRILVVERDHALYGLRFQSILGMQRCSTEIQECQVADTDPLAAFVVGSVESAGALWPVLDLKLLLTQETFCKTALAS